MNRYVLLTLWLGVIFYFSSQNYSQQSIRPLLSDTISMETINKVPDMEMRYRNSTFTLHEDPYRFIEFVVRKSAHLTVYGVLALVLYMALSPFLRKFVSRVTVVLGLVALVALCDEWNQSRFVRTPSLEDVGIDLLGASFALFLYTSFEYFAGKRRYKGHHRNT